MYLCSVEINQPLKTHTMTPKDLKKLNRANALMNQAQKLIEEVYASDKNFRYGCQSTPIKHRLNGAIGQLECVEGVLKIN